MSDIYLINEPFNGVAIDRIITNDDIQILETSGIPLAEYQKNQPNTRTCTTYEIEQLYADTLKQKCFNPVQVSSEHYYDMLGALPPARHSTVDGLTSFHMEEHLEGPLVSWFATDGKRFYEWVDFFFAHKENFIKKIQTGKQRTPEKADRFFTAKSGSESYIPQGDYCYTAEELKFDPGGKALPLKTCTCPYWAIDDSKPNQMNGYCSFLGSGDWEGEGLSLLFDQVKECRINPDLDVISNMNQT